MAFRAKLQLADGEYDALSCEYSLHRNVDAKGRPDTVVYGGAIRIVVESNDDTNIVARLMDQFKPVSGSVTFHKGGEPSPMKKLSWENGYIMKFHETFDRTDSEPMKIYFEVSAEKIKMGSETVDHKQPK
jgi:hypothetical protein